MLRVAARFTSKYFLARAGATLDGVDVPPELGLDGLWSATFDVSALPAGPHWLRVAGVDTYGGEAELFVALKRA